MHANRRRHKRGFTIIELLVVVSIIALLIGILLPAISRARDQAKQTQSLTNLRNIGAAHGTYAAEWNDRQFTLVDDTITRFGSSVVAFHQYYLAHGGSRESHQHPGPILGWGYLFGTEHYVLFAYRTHEGADETPGPFNSANASLNIPIGLPGPAFGSFRLINVSQFNQYVSGRFYDRVFYAPKDTIPVTHIEGGGYQSINCFDDPGQYCDRPVIAGVGEIPVWSSYIMSPAAMFSPRALARPALGGFKSPWQLPAGMRSPAMGHALYPALKTHMIEHHWLQARRLECNPGFSNGPYGGCEPFYFNHAWESTPIALFYDGHVESVGVRKAERADARSIVQNGHGLWSRDTVPFGTGGYFHAQGYDDAETSFHILTTDGIRGRDIMAD